MTAMREDHEQGLALFIRQAHRRRFRDSLQDEKLRRKLRRKLAHLTWLDERHAREVPTADHESLAQLLRERGAPATCFMVSEEEQLDGRELPLDDALAAVLHADFGSLLSCLPGRLALYAEEAPGRAALLERSP